MLDASNIEDIKEISKYGKANGFLIAKKYKLPTFSNFYIIENEDEAQILLERFKEQNHFCMRSDTKIGNIPIGVSGRNGNRDTIIDYIKEIRQKAAMKGTKGVAIIYWNTGKFCPVYEIDGSFYLDYITNKQLIIDYVGKGWDGSALSHGSACHETYVIPWENILFFDDNNKMKYRKKVVGEKEYNDLRKERIKQLNEQYGFQKEICEEIVPCKYKGIGNDYFREVINKVVIPMYDSSELQRYYKEYIPIVQIENGKIIVPEVILPERLKYKEKGGSIGER